MVALHTKSVHSQYTQYTLLSWLDVHAFFLETLGRPLQFNMVSSALFPLFPGRAGHDDTSKQSCVFFSPLLSQAPAPRVDDMGMTNQEDPRVGLPNQGETAWGCMGQWQDTWHTLAEGTRGGGGKKGNAAFCLHGDGVMK